MRKVIIIGSCAADIIFPAGADTLPQTTTITTGGCLLNTALLLGQQRISVSYVSEVARDALGDILLQHMSRSGVDITSVDRFSDGGVTPATLHFPTTDSDTEQTIIYHRFPDHPFDTVWPRIDPDDIVVFGSYFALDPRIRRQLTELLAYAAERNAMIIYLPEYPRQLVPGITKVMPAILENLEAAHLVITSNGALNSIYGTDNAEQCYSDKIGFYCKAAINIDSVRREIKLMLPGTSHTIAYSASPTATGSKAKAGHVAALIAALIDLGITGRTLTELPETPLIEMLKKTALQNTDTEPQQI